MNTWDEAWSDDPALFRSYLRGRRRDAYNAYRDGDTGPLQGFIELLRELRPLIRLEPWCSIYDTNVVGGYNMLAEHALDRLEFDAAQDALTCAWALLEEKTRRFRARGEQPPPESENKYRFLVWLADLKWKGPERYRNDVLLPMEMWELYEAVEEKLVSSIMQERRGPYSASSLDYGMAWCGVLLLNVGQRYQGAFLPKWLRAYEYFHPGVLQDENHPARWQFKIGEYATAERINEAVLRALYNSRNAAIIKLRGEQFPARSAIEAGRREMQYLLARNGRRLELVDASA